MKEQIRNLIKNAIKELKLNENWDESSHPEIEVDYPKNEAFGDYTTNIAMVLAKVMKMNPMEVAKKMNQQLTTNNLQQFEKVEAVKPGYINFYLSKQYLQGKVSEINEKGENFGNSKIGRGEKIHLDFVSANPTGPVTLGNGRGGTFGDVLANVLEKAGYKPWREYYVNDFGNQIKILGHSVLKDNEAQYKGSYIDDLAKKIRGTDPFEVGQKAAKLILEEIIKPSMEKIGIRFDEYFSEKSLYKSGEVEKVFHELFDKDYFYGKDGAVWFNASQFGDEKDRVVRKSTGEVTYFGGDIAYHRNKFERGFSRAVDIWGADHHGDVKRVLGAMEALGHKGKLKIILNQLLRVIKDGQEFRMSKRKGTYVSIDDLLEEVGRDAVRFFFLMYSSDTHMTFDLDLAKEQSEKNPVYYVQYAHARICSIIKKSKEDGEGDKGKRIDLGLLTHEKELALMREMGKFPELIEEIAQNCEVHRLPHYAIKLADKFHSFYAVCQVVDKQNPALTVARLSLIKSAKIVLGETLRLIGVSVPDKM